MRRIFRKQYITIRYATAKQCLKHTLEKFFEKNSCRSYIAFTSESSSASNRCLSTVLTLSSSTYFFHNWWYSKSVDNGSVNSSYDSNFKNKYNMTTEKVAILKSIISATL